MRSLLLPVFLLLLLSSCQKDKFTTVPQITFISLTPNEAASDLPVSLKDQAPKLTIRVRDAEGDIGLNPGFDTSYVYLKNLSSGFEDMMILPSLGNSAGKNFDAEIEINLFDAMDCPGNRPYIDTTYYEVYITDFAHNKSNTLTTSKPLYYHCL